MGRNSPSPMRQAMTTMSGFGTKGSQGIIKDYATEMIKRAKTPMLNRTIDADASKDKMKLTMTNIDKMDVTIKEELADQEKLATARGKTADDSPRKTLDQDGNKISDEKI